MNCKKCGADAPGIACEFCGAVQREPADGAEEMAALQAMTKAAQSIAASFVGKGVGLDKLGDEQDKRNAAISAYWASAYMPTSPEALMQAYSSALSGVQANTDMSRSHDQLNQALLSRAYAAVSALALRAPGDPRIPVAQQAIADTQARLKRDSLNMDKIHDQNAEAFKRLAPAFAIMLILIFALILMKK